MRILIFIFALIGNLTNFFGGTIPNNVVFQSCLPQGVKVTDTVEYTPRKITVLEELQQLGAYCSNGILISQVTNKGIKFFHHQCWGNQPVNYLNILNDEKNKLKELQIKYTVVEFECSPFIE